MDADSASAGFTDHLGQNMTQASMSQPNSDFNHGGFDSIPWVTGGGGLSTLSYPSDPCLDDLTPYGEFTLSTDHEAPASSKHLYNPPPAENSFMDWPAAGYIPITPYSASFSFSSTDVGETADPDPERHWNTPPSPGSPASSSNTSKKRDTDARDDEDQPSAGLVRSDLPRPAKRACADVSGPVTRAELDPRDKAPPSPSKAAKPDADLTPKIRGRSSQSNLAPGERPKIQLRTACRKPKPSPPGQSRVPDAEQDDDNLTPEERRARHSHNLVEKKYRNRLNEQFESLLAVLPAEKHGLGSENQAKGGQADHRRLSKAEVLELARQRIRALEQESLTLKLERNELLENVGLMRGVAARRARGTLPPV